MAEGWLKREVSSFNSIVALAIETDKAVEVKCRKAIDKLQGIVQRKVKAVKVDRVVPAGSFGRKTMVRGSFDVDLLVFVNEFNGNVMDWENDRQLMSMRCEVMQVLKREGYRNVEVQDGRGYSGALKLRLHPDDDLKYPVDVDLMLLPNEAKTNVPSAAVQQYKALALPVYTQPRAHTANPTREAALSEALMEPVRDTHDQVKGVVRLVKAWYKYGLVPMGVVQHVPSVLLEVVVLAAAQRLASTQDLPEVLKGGVVLQSGSLGRDLREFQLRLLCESMQLLEAAAEGRERVMVERRGDCQWGYSRAVANACAHVWGRDPVVVLHPIDPTCNIAKPRPGKPSPNWRALAAEARRLKHMSNDVDLRRPGTAMERAVAKLESLYKEQQQQQQRLQQQPSGATAIAATATTATSYFGSEAPGIPAPRREYEYEYGSGSGAGSGTACATRDSGRSGLWAGLAVAGIAGLAITAFAMAPSQPSRKR